jgi:hypothetical protein
MALERYQTGNDFVWYFRQEDYIKVKFWLSGKRTTILNGYGQYAHEGPEIIVTAAPWEMIKVDVLNRDTRTAIVIDADAVVTPELRVNGLENLWVADASVMPHFASGNTNGACMMMGMKLGRYLTRYSQ